MVNNHVKLKLASFDYTVTANSYGRVRIPTAAISCLNVKPGQAVGVIVDSKTNEMTLTRNMRNASTSYIVDEYGNTLITPASVGIKRKKFNLHADSNGVVRLTPTR